MMGVQEVTLRHDFHQLRLDVKRRLADGQPGAITDAKNVGVDRNGRLAEGDVEHNVRGLPTDAWQGLERRAIVRNFAVMLRYQRARQRDHVFRLDAVKTDGLDQVAHARFAELDHLCRRIGKIEESRRRLVDAGIGRLRRQYNGDK
jgi:hypothetical protein